MTDILIVAAFFLLLCNLWFLFVLQRQKDQREGALATRLDTFAKDQERIERLVREETARSRQEQEAASREQRRELAEAVQALKASLNQDIKGMADVQASQLGLFSNQVRTLTNTIDSRLDTIRKENADASQQLRREVSEIVTHFTTAGTLSFDSLRQSVEEKLQAIQTDSAAKLEQIKRTVDEKLQGTLEQRLGESFRQVSERLEEVHRGLGEMQALAAGVGDLKKVLGNIKTRGIWGEVQLGALLEQVLSPEQYAANVAVKGSGERVEFAIRLPGRVTDGDEPLWLPIDAKFPLEDYQRLVEAQEAGNQDAVEAAGKQLESRVRACGAEICQKYLNPPKTTDFAILFLPVEGLYAEVVRRVGLVDTLQRHHRIVVAGPTTLWAILTSLQMGFRTLAIQKRSGEVWSLLSAVKGEWAKFGDILDQIHNKLHQATEAVDKARTRTRVIGRKLKDVEEMPSSDGERLLGLDK